MLKISFETIEDFIFLPKILFFEEGYLIEGLELFFKENMFSYYFPPTYFSQKMFLENQILLKSSRWAWIILRSLDSFSLQTVCQITMPTSMVKVE